MAKFTDKNGDVWVIHLTLEDTRRLATAVGIDIFNPTEYRQLCDSLGVRIEYIFNLCRSRAEELGVESLDDFAALLMKKDIASLASDSLQEAMMSFFRRLGQEALAVMAEADLRFMRAGRKAVPQAEEAIDRLYRQTFGDQLEEGSSDNFRQKRKKRRKPGKKSSRSRLSRELTGDP